MRCNLVPLIQFQIVKNILGDVLPLVKLQVSFSKSNTNPFVFFMFLKLQVVSNRAVHQYIDASSESILRVKNSQLYAPSSTYLFT